MGPTAPPGHDGPPRSLTYCLPQFGDFGFSLQLCIDMKLIRRNIGQIVALCEKHKVRQLFVFGSILTDKFNKDSDVDFTVIFDRDNLSVVVYGENYFEFKFALEDLLKRSVDLVEYNAIKNPYFKEELDETKQLIYGKAS